MNDTINIGIVTFHRAENYGAFLQVYALQNAINQMGSNIISEVVDYQPESISKIYGIRIGGWFDKQYSLKTNVIRGLEHFFQMKDLLERKKKFHNCLNLLKLSNKLTNTPILYDVVVLGSDQIWNPIATGGVVSYYYGKYPGYSSKKTISYAASIGGMLFDKGQELLASELLSQLDAISVREKSHRDYVKKLSNKEVSIVVDPTFLVKKTLWDKFAVTPLTSKYILYYTLEKNDKLYILAETVAKERNLPLVIIAPPPLIKRKSEISIEYKYDVGPQEFVGLIKKAECVFTNSFHATCFSIIYRKEFYTYLHSTTGSRVRDLLMEVGLEGQINPKVVPQEQKEMSTVYNEVFRRLDTLREESFDYLKKNLLGEER